MEPRRFAYKPALLARRLVFETDRSGVTCRTSDGAEKWRLDWDAVTAVSFVEFGARGMDMRRLDLSADGRRLSVSCTAPAGEPAADPDAAEHLRLAATMLDRLAECHPGFEVAIGEYGRSRLAIFAIGLLSALGAAIIGVLAVATGVSGDRAAVAAVPLVTMLLFGIVLMRSCWPWRARPRLPSATLARTLRIMAGDAEDAKAPS